MNFQHLHREAVPSKAAIAACAKCGQQTYVMPLHDERGGPLFCFMCAGAWHAEHSPRRRARRVLIKAMKAYEAAGGSLHNQEFNELTLAASGFLFVRYADDVGDDFSDLTTELLNATIALTHPDKHPVERKAEANRVTQELQALKPFVFPAPVPEPPAKPDDALFSSHRDELNKASQRLTFPCDDCCDTIPAFYCDPCKAQHEKKCQQESEREEQERQRKNKCQREYYQINKAVRPPIACATCGNKFESKRSDAKYCSAACRQRAYVKRDGKASNARPFRSNDIERAIEIAFTTKPDSAFTTEDLCGLVYSGLEQIERKHRAAVLPIAKKVCEQLETWDWWKPSNCGLVFWNRVSLISTAISNLKYRARYDSEKKQLAAISPGGDWHTEVVEGGGWWNAWQEDVAEFKKRRAA
jgi:hypothetical protein